MDIAPILWTAVGVVLAVGLCFGAAGFAIWLRRRLGGGTVADLRAGRQYVVVRSFTDYHGGRFESGERLTFKRHDYVPYHGGHVLEFEGRAVYLQDEENADVLGRIWSYIKPAPR